MCSAKKLGTCNVQQGKGELKMRNALQRNRINGAEGGGRTRGRLLIDELGQSSHRMTAIRNRHAPRTHRISWDNHNPKQLRWRNAPFGKRQFDTLGGKRSWTIAR
jgi:hypothetical protein